VSLKWLNISVYPALFLLVFRCSVQTTYLNEKREPVRDPRAVSLFIDGLNFELDRNYPAALLMYQEALLYDSTSSTIYLNIAKNYLRLGKEESALLALKRCVELNPDKMEAWTILASIYAGHGWWDLVEKTYLSIIERDSTDIETMMKLATLYHRLDKKNDAEKYYKKLLSIQSTPDPKILIALGDIYFEQDRYKEANLVFSQLISVNPESGFGYFGLGLTCEAIKDTAGAIKHYQEAILKTPSLNEARDRLGKLYIDKQYWGEAIALYSEAVRTDTTDLRSWLELGDLYQQSGDSTQAGSVYQEVRSRFPEEWQAHFQYGRFLMRQQHYLEALQPLKKVVRLVPDQVLGWLFSGICYTHLDSLDAAEKNLSRAVMLEPANALTQYYLGMLYSERSAYEKAVNHLQRALKEQPGWVSAMNMLANTYESLKFFQKTDSVYQAAIKIEPANALILNNYAYTLSLRSERLDEALLMALNALELEPDNGAYLDTVGWIYYKMGQVRDALSYIERAAAARPESVEVFDHLGDVYAAMDMPEKAREAWIHALELDENSQEIKRKLGQLRSD
jgi:tetratricopeptide (TPR) repeat protein